ncbi:MAG: imidazole glycerol phosphate synthase subunit HisH [Desulfamplus sp.]|nr:imidazole glycerol phosphate synthase subunit HisH [Desulfamplus sp.]
MGIPVVIVDYGMGNLWSVRSALTYLGCDSVISRSPSEIEKAGMLILPGVGSFRQAMLALRHTQLDQAILEAVSGRGSKILGICLGMQLMADHGTEDGETKGLGLIPTRVERFDHSQIEGLKVPHIGFNHVLSDQDSILFSGIASPAYFYFVHAYRLLPDGLPGRHAICQYGQKFLAAYEHENVFATQFHPEKSQSNGLMVLKNFISW